MTLVSPISYQGGKQRIATQIVDKISVNSDQIFCDLCCGSGAVSIELINRGFNPKQIVMLDQGPWGIFWKSIGTGNFDLSIFKNFCDSLPKDRSEIKKYLEDLSKTSAIGDDVVYKFLLLQAGSFGGKALWITDGCWKNTSFRSYWQPTQTSNRKSPVNPMMPMPETLFERVARLCEKMVGVSVSHQDICEFVPPENSVVYIDPPYDNTTMYGYTFDVLAYVKSLKNRCYVSEGKTLSEKSYLLSGGRKKGGISGERKVSPNEEWLSEFNHEDFTRIP